MKLLRWDPEREDTYIDCEAESVEALPSDVPPVPAARCGRTAASG
jgi:hypothetical protein